MTEQAHHRSGDPAHSPRWHRRSAERPAEITRAALEVFARKGFTTARMEDIARHAGVSSGTIYRYFESKEDVLKAAVRESLVSAVHQTEEAITNHAGTNDELIRKVLGGWFRSLVGTPAAVIPKLIVAEAANFPELARFYLDEVVRPARQDLRRVLSKGAAEGAFRRIDPCYGSALLIAPLVWFFVWQESLGAFDDEPLDAERYFEAGMGLMLDGLRPRGDPRREPST